MRFYLDEDLSPKIAGLLRDKGLDCISAHETGMLGRSDLEQLMFAYSKKRCFVTKNRDDFIRLTVQFFNDNLPHFGLLIISYKIPGDRFSNIADAIVAYDNDHPEGIPNYMVDFIS